MNYQLNEAKMYADIAEGTAIIIDSTTGIYFGLNGFATSVYENLVAGASVEEIKAAAKQLTGAPAGIDADIDAFIEDLLAKEIIEPAAESSAAVALSADAAEADGFVLDCTAFEDAQELLLADPIHEVKEDEGWSPELSSLNEDKEDVARREAKLES